MTIVVVAITFLVALWVTAQRGLAAGFAWVYVPVQLFISSAPQVVVPAWPDVGPPHAVLYGILLGVIAAGGRVPDFRWSLVDTLVLAVSLCYVVSGMFTEELYTGVSLIGEKGLEWVLPYFLARMTFASERGREDTLRVTCWCLFVLAFAGLIEFRLWPYWLTRNLQALGLWTGTNDMAYHRFGFFRAQLSFQHPIDLGNVALLLTGLIPLLASTTRYGLRDRFVQAGWACAFFLVIASISFTAFLGVGAGLVMFYLMYRARAARQMVVPLVLFGMACLVSYTAYVVSQPLGARPPRTDLLADSLWIRKLIMHRAWGMASTAGVLGWGKILNMRELQLTSVDNAYMLMTMMRGWLTVGLFVMIPIVLGHRTKRAFERAVGDRQRLPLAIAMATVAAIMAAMYTVWFGFVYANIFFVTIAFATTLTEFYLYQPRAVAAPAMVPEDFEIGAGATGYVPGVDPTDVGAVPLMHQADWARG